ncbi:MAG: hypothetical protein MOGMAGMI_00003 [Candidatus Omnitrophica bacterium]|nr:hypothetical protein [Candidatus Omnitrophota bacterium]
MTHRAGRIAPASTTNIQEYPLRRILHRLLQSCIVTSLLLSASSSALANNMTVSNATLTSPNSTSNTIKVQFDISWQNSWRNATNRDAAWVFVKYSTDEGVTWSHATLKTAGTNPSDTSSGTGTSVNIIVPADKKGAFIERSANGDGTTTLTEVQLTWDYGADGLADNTIARVKVFGLEMVYVPTAAYSAGDGSSTSSFQQGSGDTDSWAVSGPGAISVTNTASNGYYDGGSTYTIPAAFPEGYNAFYLMKYEITQGQYMDFLNTLSRAQQINRVASTISADTISNTYVMANSSSYTNRSAIQAPSSGNGTTAPVVFNVTYSSNSKADRACNYLSWMDGCAYADWAALRPITELEYEKAARGTSSDVNGEFAWGSTSITAAATISGTENGTETISTSSANAHYNNTTLSGGDGGTTGPLRAGIFATSSSTRSQSGAGYYGAMELSGNVRERCVTVGHATGRAFLGTHGDGVLTTETSYEGNATNADWPGIDGTTTRGVTGATGSGSRGGDWSDSGSTTLRVSDRSVATTVDTTRTSDLGFRAGRSA